MSDLYIIVNTREKLRELLLFILNTSQVTVGQLRRFEMTPLGTLTTFDAYVLDTLHLVTAGNRFPSNISKFKPFDLGHQGPWSRGCSFDVEDNKIPT